jgi:hypothetical protein
MVEHKQNQPTNHQHQAASSNYNHLEPSTTTNFHTAAIPNLPKVAPRTLPAMIQLPANVEWFDTGVALCAGDGVTISASGDVYVGALPDLRLDYETPDGSPIVTTGDPQFPMPFVAPGFVPWSLVGKMGTNGQPFQAGSRCTVIAPIAGELYLSVNDDNFTDNSGSWLVTIIAANTATQPSTATLHTNGSSHSSQGRPTMENAGPIPPPPIATPTNSATPLPSPATPTPLPPK